MEEDIVVVGFGTAGDIKHVSKYGAEFKENARNCAKQIRRNYKSVRIVTETEFQKLMEKDDERRKEYWCY